VCRSLRHTECACYCSCDSNSFADPKPGCAPAYPGPASLIVVLRFLSRKPSGDRLSGHANGEYLSINPARDLAPRLFTFLASWGGEVFCAGHFWWWVPIVGPMLGGVLGGWVYDLLVTRHHPPEPSSASA